MTWLKGLFKKDLEPISFNVLGCDVHSHLIPGIDDGSPDLETSISIIKNLKDLGFKKIITTPHIMSDYYRNNPEIIKSGLKKVQNELKNQSIDFSIEAGAEYFLDFEFSEKLETERLLSWGDNYLLVEVSFVATPPRFYDTIFQIQLKKYKVVLAHPERYLFMSIDELKELKQKNVFLQLNLLSLIGYYGKEVEKRAKVLIDLEMVDFVGTDCHNLHQSVLLQQCQTNKYWHKLVAQNKFSIQSSL
jgi:tyrosine-protein phosphatase YwqE